MIILFFDLIIFGKISDKNKARDVLGNDFYSGLLEIKDDIHLNKTI